MSFLSTIGYLETPEQEAARLATAPEGSRTYELSTLPVTIHEWPQDLLIELPQTDGHRVVVVPTDYRGDSQPEDRRPRHRHAGWWACAVVASNHPDYPVGGHRLAIPTAELVRGEKVDLFATVAPF